MFVHGARLGTSAILLCVTGTRASKIFLARRRVSARRFASDAMRRVPDTPQPCLGSCARRPPVRRPPVVRRELCSCARRSPGARRAAAATCPPAGRRLPVAAPAQADTAARRTPVCCRAALRTELPSPPCRPSAVVETTAERKLAAAEMEGRRRAAVETEGGGGQWRWKRRSGG